MRLMYYSTLLRPGRLRPRDIAGLRHCRGFSQGRFDRLLGVSQPVLCRWETGKRRPSRTSDMAVRLGFLVFPPLLEPLRWESEVQTRLAGLIGKLVRLPDRETGSVALDVRKQPKELIEEIIRWAEEIAGVKTFEEIEPMAAHA